MKCGSSGIKVGTSRLNLLSCNSFSSFPVLSLPFISVLHKQRCSNKREGFCFVPLIPFALQARRELSLFSGRKQSFLMNPRDKIQLGYRIKTALDKIAVRTVWDSLVFIFLPYLGRSVGSGNIVFFGFC